MAGKREGRKADRRNFVDGAWIKGYIWFVVLAIVIKNCQIGRGGMETTVDRFGRVVIPKKIRDVYNLEPGTQVRIEEEQDAIILKPVRGEQNLQWKDGVLVYSGVPMGDLAEAVSKHREERARSVRRLK